MNLNEEIVHFVIGTSAFILIYPSIYFYYTYSKMSEDEKLSLSISLHSLLFFSPIIYGILFAVLYRTLSIIPRKYETFYIRFAICGALAAVLCSLVLHYGFNFYDEWVECDTPEMCHIAVFAFYLVLYITVGTWLRTQLLYGPQAPSSSSVSGGSTSPIKIPSVGSISNSLNLASPNSIRPIPSKSSASANVFDSLQEKSQSR